MLSIIVHRQFSNIISLNASRILIFVLEMGIAWVISQEKSQIPDSNAKIDLTQAVYCKLFNFFGKKHYVYEYMETSTGKQISQ